MSAAEFKALREHLGVTGDKAAALLGVSDRQVRKWEGGTAPVPAGITAELGRMLDQTADVVEGLVATDGPLVTYRTDEDFLRVHPDSPWSASWHRAACARVLEKAPHRTIVFADE